MSVVLSLLVSACLWLDSNSLVPEGLRTTPGGRPSLRHTAAVTAVTRQSEMNIMENLVA